jgi:outer membrane protein assembly factor BamE
MKDAIKKSIIVMAALTLTACGSMGDFGAYKTGTQISQEQMDKLIDKKTTQSNAIALLGQPNRKAELGGKEIWNYDYTQIGQAIVGKNINETTVLEFNKHGVLVTHYKTNGGGQSSSNPLLKAAGM